MLLTGCTVTQSLPYDDVYNTGSSPVPQQQVATTTYTTPGATKSNVYKEGNVQVVSMGQNDTLQHAGTNQKEVVLIKKDTAQAATTINNYYSSLDFDSPYFGTGASGWSLGGYNWYLGGNYYGGYWNSFYPYYNPYSWNYPYNWYWGGYPYYSWYSPYYWNYPYYGSYYPYYYGYSPYYYSNTRYGHRSSFLNGGNIPRRGVTGGNILHSSLKNSRITSVNRNTKSAVNGSDKGTGLRRPAGSIRYQKALKEGKTAQNEKRARFQKPEETRFRGTNGTRVQTHSFRGGNVPLRSFKNEQVQQEKTARPRFQKPRQYQSLDNRNPRSSKEYYRQQPNLLRKTTNTRTLKTTRRFNVYRPSTRQQVNQRPVYRNTNTRTIRYRPATNNRVIRTNNFKSTRRNFTPTKRTYRPSNNNFNRTRSTGTTFRNTGGNSGGSRSTGGGSRTTGGGGGSPHRR